MLSAPVGEGHVAAARALAARMRALWPGADVVEIEGTGRGGARRDALLRTAYAVTMRRAPWLYGLGYDLVRDPRVARPFKALTAARFARALAPLLDPPPDLVFSTYPMISGGLARLRRRGRLPCRAVAVATDVAVHPFWVWPELDETWTLLPGSRAQALAIAPAADVRVAPPAVDRRFRPGDRAAARAATGLPAEGFVVLVTGGSLAFGGLGPVVDAVLAAGEDVLGVVLCGRNDRLRAGLSARGLPAGRLRALGWTDRVPDLVTAADVVLTTAGGMIASEALAAGRPVLFATPVPGHGRAGAELTAEAGLALVCPRPADVTEALRDLRARPERLRALTEAAQRFGRTDLDDALRALVGRLAPTGG